jgi:4-methyl-5(b-hydroxyethyl)-thiazole monophosphate biosynthesis
MNKTILVHLAEGFEEIEALTQVDVLRRAGFDVKTVSISQNKEVTGAHNIPIIADELFENVNYDEADMIVLPGGMPGSKHLNAHHELKVQVQKYYDSGKWLAAICAAPIILADLDLIKGRRVTCYPAFEEKMEGATVTGNPVEVDGNIITGRGPGAAMEFGLTLLEKLDSAAKRDELAEKMVVVE